jgi:hypothetical protein
VFTVVLAVASASWCTSALADGDTNMGSCPNETLSGFQPSLPDCRAYEQVTPPAKGGQQLNEIRATASDGSAMLVDSLVGFEGVEGDSHLPGTDYRLSRAADGWVAAPLNPPATTFPTEEIVGESTDLRSTLWKAREAAQSIYTEDLYLRDGENDPVKVGEMVPPSAEAGPAAGGYIPFNEWYEYTGASNDATRVLVSASLAGADAGALWPGDTTQQGASLYEYEGTENATPRLVGLNSEGHLISSCETRLGSGADLYNAISAGGRTVFFTAVGHNACPESIPAPTVSELYARVDGLETVPISEPTPTQCAECQIESRAPAQFGGASEDGTKVFFTTTQELLAGARSTNLYQYDFAAAHGHKVSRVSSGTEEPEVLGVARVSQDGSHLYFVARGVLTPEPDLSLAPGHQNAVAGQPNLYVYEQDSTHPSGHIGFLATLSEEDSALWQEGDFRPAQATPDGHFFLFRSASDLTPGDSSSLPQLFLYDAVNGGLVRVSVGQQGYPAGTVSADAHEARFPEQIYSIPRYYSTKGSRLAIAEDGDKVIFQSAAALTPEAAGSQEAGAESVYLYERTSPHVAGNVYLIAAGSSGASANAIGLDPSGADVFFETAAPLVPQDSDTQYDIYDARVDGGFALVTPSVCEGEACHSYPGGNVPTSPPLSAALAPEGSLPTIPAIKPSAAKRQARNSALRRALRLCRHKRGRARRRCEAHAHRLYAQGTSRPGNTGHR